MHGLELGAGTQHLLQEAAQLRRVAHAAVVERIDDMAGAVDADADQEVSGKGQAFGLPGLGTRDMQVKDRQGHRQALASLDDPDEIGILQVVVGFTVAAVGVGARNDVGQCFRLGTPAAHQVGNLVGHCRDMLTERYEIEALFGMKGAERQARFEQIQPLAVTGTEVAQPRQALPMPILSRIVLAARHALLRRPPDVGQMMWPEAAHQHRVETHRTHGIARMLGEEQAGGARHTAELALAQRFGGRRHLPPGLDLDEGEHVAAPRHDVDLAQACLVATRQDRVAGQAQPPHRPPFRGMAQPMGALAGLDAHAAPRFSSSARA